MLLQQQIVETQFYCFMKAQNNYGLYLVVQPSGDLSLINLGLCPSQTYWLSNDPCNSRISRFTFYLELAFCFGYATEYLEYSLTIQQFGMFDMNDYTFYFIKCNIFRVTSIPTTSDSPSLR